MIISPKRSGNAKSHINTTDMRCVDLLPAVTEPLVARSHKMDLLLLAQELQNS
jgi:hypothetical protein